MQFISNFKRQFLVLLLFFSDRISLCCPCKPQTLDPPTSSSQVAGITSAPIVPNPKSNFQVGIPQIFWAVTLSLVFMYHSTKTGDAQCAYVKPGMCAIAYVLSGTPPSHLCRDNYVTSVRSPQLLCLFLPSFLSFIPSIFLSRPFPVFLHD